MEIKTKENLYTVIKNEDLIHTLTETERQVLGLILHKIAQVTPGRKYYVVNQDEPYAHKVLETILDGEESKLEKTYAERIEQVMYAGLTSLVAFNPSIEDKAVNRISFTFTSYPLLGKLKEEMQPAIEAVSQEMLNLKATSWKLGSVERFRDTFSFQDVYTGDILIEQKDDTLEL